MAPTRSTSFPLRGLLASAATVLAICSGTAQADPTGYEGLLDGIHPLSLKLAPQSPAAELRFGSAAAVRFVGGCDDRACAYRAVDTALAWTATQVGDTLRGTLRDGAAREQPFLVVRGGLPAEAVARWVRTWQMPATDSTAALEVTLASLGGARVLGTVFLGAYATSFRAEGLTEGDSLALRLRRFDGAPVGALTLASTGPSGFAGEVAGRLLVEGAAEPVTLALAHELATGTLRRDGRYDLVYPLAPTQRASDAIAARAVALWDQLPELGERATGWFEPTRVDESVISGWLHLRGERGGRSLAVNVNPRSGRSIRPAVVTGGRRQRLAAEEAAYERAVQQHPLAGDEAFAAWARTQQLDGFALAREGVVYGSDDHPVYGQLRWVEPWDRFELRRELPYWVKGE